MKKALVLIFQLAVSTSLLLWMFREPGFRKDVAETFQRADPVWVGVAAAVAGVGVVLGFVRWGIFLKVVGIEIPAWQVFRMGAVGLFFSSFLPGAIGGDAVKAGWLVARGARMKDSLLSILMDRMSGIGALVLCSAVFIGLRFEWLMQSAVVAAMIHMVILYLVVVIALLVFSFLAASKGAVARIPEKMPGRNVIVEFSGTYSLFVTQWRMTLLAAGISVGMLMAYFLTFYFCALALGVPIPALDFLSLMPAVDILAALPISVGGFGVREGAFVTLLGQLSAVAPAAAVSISFAGAFLNLLWGCLGILVLPGFKREARQ
jgi:uncharacterized protein (TIRG00374 family)